MTGLNNKPILVIGIGNPLLSDDGVGLQLLENISKKSNELSDDIEYIDGGTQGIALLGRIANRKAILFLDAIAMGDSPGTIHELTGDEVLKHKSEKTTAHESGAADILRTAMLTGDLPASVHIIGIEPEELKTSIGLSEKVQNSLAMAEERIISCLESILDNLK